MQNGQHCTNANCLMDVAPISINHFLAKPFCDECIQAMRENLQQLLEDENSLSVNSINLDDTNHVDPSWKKPLRDFYTQTAK